MLWTAQNRLVSLLQASLRLVNEDDPLLRTRAVEWDFRMFPPDGAMDLVHNMECVMRTHGGIGLAAPQVGILRRLFIMRDERGLHACFNPMVLHWSTEVESRREGCLSFPGLLLPVERSVEVEVSYQDAWGNPRQEHLAGISARCYQHEMDHLDGVCIINHASKLALNIAQRKRNKVLKRNNT